MLNKIKETYKKLEIKETETTYLTSAFLMADPKNLKETNWQLDFYNKEDDTLTSYKMENGKVQKQVNSEIFKKSKQPIPKLNLEEAKTEFEQAFEKAQELLKEKKDSIHKIIAILQVIDGKIIWNVSLMTSNFFLLNIKIDAKTGELIKESYTSLLSFKS